MNDNYQEKDDNRIWSYETRDGLRLWIKLPDGKICFISEYVPTKNLWASAYFDSDGDPFVEWWSTGRIDNVDSIMVHYYHLLTEYE